LYRIYSQIEHRFEDNLTPWHCQWQQNTATY
jgi:hypothetical protein